MIVVLMYIYYLFPIGFENVSSFQYSHISFYLLNFEFIFLITNIVPFSTMLEHYENKVMGAASSSKFLIYFKRNSYIQDNIIGGTNVDVMVTE